MHIIHNNSASFVAKFNSLDIEVEEFLLERFLLLITLCLGVVTERYWRHSIEGKTIKISFLMHCGSRERKMRLVS